MQVNAEYIGSAPPPNQKIPYLFQTVDESDIHVPHVLVTIPSINIQFTTDENGYYTLIQNPSNVIHHITASKDGYYAEKDISFSPNLGIQFIITMKKNNSPNKTNTPPTQPPTINPPPPSPKPESIITTIKPDPIPKNKTENKSVIENLTEEQVNKLKEALGIEIEKQGSIKFANIECGDDENQKKNKCCMFNPKTGEHIATKIAESIFLRMQQRNILLTGDVTCIDRDTSIRICFSTQEAYFTGELLKIHGEYCEEAPAFTSFSEPEKAGDVYFPECGGVDCSNIKNRNNNCCNTKEINKELNEKGILDNPATWAAAVIITAVAVIAYLINKNPKKTANKKLFDKIT